MSNSVLFDAPGPKTIVRHRIYTAVASLFILALLGYVAYRLDDAGQFEYSKWEPFVTPKYDNALFDGLVTTLQMAFSAIIGAVVFGVVFGVGKLSDHAWVRWPSALVVEFFRAVPVLLLMILVYFSYGISRGDSGSYWSAVLALTLYNGAVLAEIFRAGVNAVPDGQAEAAYAIGMRKTQVMTIILLPQAVKIMLPAIISQAVVTLKDTSLAYAIGAPGLAKVGTQIYQPFQNQLPTIFVVAVMYIIVNLLLSAIATWVQKKLVGEKSPLELTKVGNMDGGRAV